MKKPAMQFACAALAVIGASLAGQAAAQDGQPAGPAAQATRPAMAGHAVMPHCGGHGMMDHMCDMQRQMAEISMTGDQDVDFATLMRAHHQAGIAMATAELKNGKDPALQRMAKKIVADHEKEVRKLDEWLAKHRAASR